MIYTAVHDMGFSGTAGQGRDAGLHLRNHTAVDAAADDQFLRFFEAQGGQEAVFVVIIFVDALDIGQDDQFFRLQGAGDLASRTVCVDVVRFSLLADACRGDDRDAAGIEEDIQKFRVDGFHAAHKPDIDQVDFAVFIHIGQMLLGHDEVCVLPVQADGLAPQAVHFGYQVRVRTADEGHLRQGHSLFVRHAQAIDESRLLASLLQHLRHFGAGCMDHDGAQPGALQEDDVLKQLFAQGRVRHGLPAEFDDDDFILEIPQIRQCLYQNADIFVS